MLGMMMDRPLLIAPVIEYAARNFPDQEVVSGAVEGGVHRYTYVDAARRSRQMANALKALGVSPEDRVGTIAWNTYRHLELYYGISGIGAVCHTINPRLPADQFGYVVNHAKDQFLFIDLTFVPLVEKLQAMFEGVRGYVIMTDAEHMPETSLPNVHCYEDLLAAQSDELEWPEFDENTASSLCYTSGTTGNPKGVLYSHRSSLLHSLCVLATPGLDMGEEKALLPVVPMFHVNAWGVPYFALMVGAKIVFPGPRLDGASLSSLMNEEGVTDAWGVPTVWMGLLGHMRSTGEKFRSLSRVMIGGSAAPKAMMKEFQEKHGIDAIQGWGMTEMSPIGTISLVRPKDRDLPLDKQIDMKAKQGRAMFGVEMKIVDDSGKSLPHDGVAQGELLVRGPAVISGYYENPEASKKAFDADGWFRTGDVSRIDKEGYMEIVDRTKDVIKSGGEWISSIDLENAAVGHPEIAEAAVIGVPHPKWDERPLLVVVREANSSVDKAGVLQFLEDKIAKWQLPDDVVFVDELPHGATGKLQKAKLREDFKDFRLSGE
ncbi:long-chain-fatty-acid--CoA ligase [Hydrocarboniclastica marina]|uniref:Long-chain fatty acid--CoA ligase n=1 Tax=Hydrocarboniclastica marina TaxID=2259620 RepID=A0A4P7XLV9_9ALTE|nr:long-chain-fatty-acid--CoA ligase [Hydrocarboniclastica marina]QCF26967.1 long-chain fatty acid--CoA ligase [Hydrocarboniclastica marina]